MSDEPAAEHQHVALPPWLRVWERRLLALLLLLNVGDVLSSVAGYRLGATEQLLPTGSGLLPLVVKAGGLVVVASLLVLTARRDRLVYLVSLAGCCCALMVVDASNVLTVYFYLTHR